MDAELADKDKEIARLRAALVEAGMAHELCEVYQIVKKALEANK